jgi:hypothetical protein
VRVLVDTCWVTMTDGAKQALEKAREPEAHKTWVDKDVFYTVVLGVIVIGALWVGLSSGFDCVHIGQSGCPSSRDGFTQMPLQCGTGLAGGGSPPSQ